MTKQILPLLLVLGFTACNEYQPDIPHTVSNNSSASIVEKEEADIPTPKPTQEYIRTPIPILDD